MVENGGRNLQILYTKRAIDTGNHILAILSYCYARVQHHSSSSVLFLHLWSESKHEDGEAAAPHKADAKLAHFNSPKVT
jgi:hypothetical protein